MDRQPKQRKPRVSAQVKAQVLEALRAGGTRKGIARQFGISDHTVRAVARAAGLPIGQVPPELQLATEVHVLHAKARRAALKAEALDGARRVLGQLFQPRTTWVFDGKEGEWRSLELPEPDSKALRDLAITFGILTDKALELDRYDAEGATASRGALLEMYSRLSAEEVAAG